MTYTSFKIFIKFVKTVEFQQNQKPTSLLMKSYIRRV